MFSQFHIASLAERESEPVRSLQSGEDSREQEKEPAAAWDIIIRQNSFPVPQSSPGCLGGGEGA